MSMPLDRILDAICASLRQEVIPRLDDPYARAQAFAAIDLLANLRPRVDWSAEVLRADAETLQAGARQAAEALAGTPGAPVVEMECVPAPGPSPADLVALRDRLEEQVATLLDWLEGPGGDSPAARRAEAPLRAALRELLDRDVKRASKPLFAEMAAASPENPSRKTTA